jgi:hypothetical protein
MRDMLLIPKGNPGQVQFLPGGFFVDLHTNAVAAASQRCPQRRGHCL